MSIASDTLKKLITERRQARVRRENAQVKLIDDNDVFKASIEAKLLPLNTSTQAWNFARCGQEAIYRTCKDCGKVHEYSYRCNLKWCPRCQWRVTQTRQRVIRAWAGHIHQAKHLVTTQSNFEILTRRALRTHTRNLAKLRRKKCFEKVRGGCVSTEITNEGRGWHLHAHWLLDTDWLDMAKVSVAWGKLVGQNFAIVKVKDVRQTEYAAELVKYLAKGSEIASWPSERINEFVQAIRGVRFFGSFGSLWKIAPEIRRELAAQRPPPMICECGGSRFDFSTEVGEVLRESRKT